MDRPWRRADVADDAGVDRDGDGAVDDGRATGDGLAGVDVSRRRVLTGAAAAGLGLGGFRALDNVVLGYGVVVGTNLVDQDLAALAREDLEPSRYRTTVDGRELAYGAGTVTVDGPDGTDRARVAATPAWRARRIDERHGLPGAPVTELVEDLGAVADGRYGFRFMGYEEFFATLEGAATRPHTVGALRGEGFGGVAPATVERFAGAHPRDPAGTIEGLADGFRDATSYDIPRYLAGSVEDNLLFGAVDLRRHFESPTDFGALEAGENDGMFCYEFSRRAVEALHAVDPAEQSPPVMGAVVHDRRHKHVFNGVASAFREDSELVIPMTFVDYTHSTLYDDLGLRGVLGEGVDAYGTRHRATDIDWDR